MDLRHLKNLLNKDITRGSRQRLRDEIGRRANARVAGLNTLKGLRND